MTSQLDMFARDVRPAAARAEASRARRQTSTSFSETEMLAALKATGRYRILRKLEARAVASEVRPGFPLRGVILDTETTGLDARKCEIIEIGLVSFTYNEEGEIGDVVAIYGGLQQPTIAIPPDITRLTGITDAMVAGQSIDIAAVQAIVGPADLIIAHNAGFDRPFCEAFSDVFVRKAWACSVSEIDWSGRGFEGTKLGYLIGQSGYFHDGHRAVDDCFALLEVLEQSSGGAALPPFAELYKTSQRSRVRIFAENAPFDLKDVLKARGYRWSDGSDGRPKSWWIEVAEDELEAELGFLRKEIYRWDEADPPTQRLTAFDRYRARR
ncbi:3'-5' exonuclease [Sinorhizobium meliloti]|uniref:3'-5' exonuclease n=1 Tax=Rhizobium meliloti TaxID=382 RepID=UPI000FD2DDCA|nr:3'-5' exonuclease [Sinorhizobium meliloti]RVM07545.1 3'-5' exonuclease [Sinorhizobium meliloti]RVM46090.1 3'-5' exonuclease [Sinorhizobium meliloti]RVM62549.1 3'-5' exonuclease [Sinorhizobium meliloti]RVM70155.1 3'-5' exonuclease [Sinorhizobium meliloti]RVM86169.1 3'-5' exonuclease [Sinorhizobium meliloti]